MERKEKKITEYGELENNEKRQGDLWKRGSKKECEEGRKVE